MKKGGLHPIFLTKKKVGYTDSLAYFENVNSCNNEDSKDLLNQRLFFLLHFLQLFFFDKILRNTQFEFKM